jgi:hypothetical protein
MGQYISFSKTDKDADIFYSVRLNGDVYTEIAHTLPAMDIDSYGTLMSLNVAALLSVRDEIISSIARVKTSMFLDLLKRDFDTDDMAGTIEYYESLLTDLAIVNMIIDIASDNEGVLYASVG